VRFGLRQFYFAASAVCILAALIASPSVSMYAWGLAGGFLVVALWS
jgi:hypothetical protein